MLTENQLFANRYRLVKRLGQGAFSEVWKAEDTLVGNLTVALKVYAPDKGLDEDGAKVFGDEFAIVFNLHHQNLLTPSTFDKEKNSPYLVLPFCEQGSSLKLVGKMDERQAAKFLHDVSAALAYLHESEIVHQDIKPDNVLMDAKGNFLVTDFGISTRIRSTLRRSVGGKSSSGTSAYMGPERFSKTPAPIKASDVWSLGATVFELLTGDVPYGDMGGGLQKIGAEVPDLPEEYSAGLKSLIERCLSPEPWDRPTATQLRDITDHYLRTGAWDLSSLNKGGTQEPEKPKAPAGRPTERKVIAPKSGQTAREKPTKEIPTMPKIEKPKPAADKVPNTARRKRLPWFIGGTVALVLLAVVLGLTSGKWKKLYAKSLAKTYTVNGVSFTMKFVEGGTFQMGATPEQGDDVHYSEEPAHFVTLRDYCIGETEVTQALWLAVMGAEPSDCGGWTDKSGRGSTYPAYMVSWDDCQEFIKKLNKLTGKKFRLPTEAEWEYAARGGNKSRGCKFAGSNTISEVAWYRQNSGDQYLEDDDWKRMMNNNPKTHPVKTKKPNELELYDMSGNVEEWCSDWYGRYGSSAKSDPTGPAKGSEHICRGGGYISTPHWCRISRRYYWASCLRFPDIGFRLVVTP